MRTIVYALTLSLMSSVAVAEEKPLPVCDVMKANEGLECLQKNILTLNKRIEDLNNTLEKKIEVANETINTKIDGVDKRIDSVKSSAITDGTMVEIQSRYSSLKKCLWQPNFDQVNAVDCAPVISWRLQRVP